jgi:hypothetical protein
MELSLDCTVDEAGHPTSVSLELSSLKPQCQDERCPGGSKLNPAFFFALNGLPLHFFIQESSIVLRIDGFLTSEKVQVNVPFESQNTAVIIFPAEKIAFTYFGGGEWVCLRCLLALFDSGVK